MTTVNLKGWQTKFSEQTKTSLRRQKVVIEEAAQILFDNIKKDTPLGDPTLWNYPAPAGYTPGTLKAGWNIEKSEASIIISNYVPYGERVETGWSTQAPEGMMRLNAAKWSRYISIAYRRYKRR
jgi:hypothetical protein